MASDSNDDNKPKVLVSAPYILPVIDKFRPFFDSNGIELVLPPVEERMEADALLEWATDVDGTICGDDRYNAEVLKACSKRLKVISKWGTGIDSIDQKTCKELGIAVCNTPNAFSEPVSDTVMGYMLCFARQLPATTAAMRRGEWEKIPGKALRECTLGVIGVGNVGKAVIHRAVAFGMTVLGNDIVDIDKHYVAQMNIKMVTKEELLRRSDFVSLNCDHNPTSHHIMNDEAFALMKPSAVLINTARGPLVHEEALVRALESGKIAGAGLDVFEHEPLPKDSPLRSMPQVMMSPHNSNTSPQAWERVHVNTINNLIKVFQKSFPEKKFHLYDPKIKDGGSSGDGGTAAPEITPLTPGKRVVLITGVAGGIGNSTARVFWEAGWHVVGVDRRHVETEQSGWVDHFILSDISNTGSAKEIIEQVRANEGRLDALVNNAAMQVCKSVLDTTVEEWDEVMASNVRQIFLISIAAFPLLKETKGAIVHISSVHALATSRGIAAYASSKGAILAMTRNMALDMGLFDVRCNAVLPGAVDTGMLRSGLGRDHVQGGDVEEKVRALGKKHVMGRVGKPEEVGEAILFLADGERSSFITGQPLVVDGGAMCRLSTE